MKVDLVRDQRSKLFTKSKRNPQMILWDSKTVVATPRMCCSHCNPAVHYASTAALTMDDYNHVLFGYRHVPDQELNDFSERICIYGLTIMNSNYEYVMHGMPAQLRHNVQTQGFGCMEAYTCVCFRTSTISCYRPVAPISGFCLLCM